jgi:two-component system response regulator AtoC
MILAKDRLITPAELPSSITSYHEAAPLAEPEDTLSIKKATRDLEKKLIKKVLQLTDGNRSKASGILEISRPILIAKIKEYGL